MPTTDTLVEEVDYEPLIGLFRKRSAGEGVTTRRARVVSLR